MNRRVLYILPVVIFLVSACGLMEFCDLDAYDQSLEPLLQEWDAVVDQASETLRADLAGTIAEMQDIRQRTADLAVDDCLQDAHSQLLLYMEGIIEGHMMFYEGEPDDAVRQRIESAEAVFNDYIELITQIAEGD